MKCCICAKPVTEQQAKKHEVIVQDQRIATCCDQCKSEAKKHPDHCKINSDTAMELTPLG